MLAENIKKIYLGGSEVQKMYLGENLIYPREPAVDDYVMLGTTTGSTDFMIGNSTDKKESPDCIKVHVVQKPGGNNEMYVKQDDVLKVPVFFYSNYNGFSTDEGKKILSIDKWNIDTSNVTDMGQMFSNCTELASLDFSNFNTTNVTDMNWMFSSCSSLKTLDLSNFNTSNVTNMSGMFFGCSSLKTLDLSNFNTSNVNDMGQMFYNCTELASLDLRSFDTRDVKYMFYMFYGCSSLTSLDLRSFDTYNVINNTYMFHSCSKLNKLYLSSSFFNSGSITTYDFSQLKSWTDPESLDMFYLAIIDVDGRGKTLKLSSNTYNALKSYYIDNINSRGWKIMH